MKLAKNSRQTNEVWKYLLTFRELKKKEYERERKRKWRRVSRAK